MRATRGAAARTWATAPSGAASPARSLNICLPISTLNKPRINDKSRKLALLRALPVRGTTEIH